MSAGGGAALYSPELLALAVSLAEYPLDEGLPARGEARSRSCGSTLAFACGLDSEGRIARPGLRVAACAVGQAAAAVFVAHASGRGAGEIERALGEVERWLSGTGETPQWPGLAALEPARAYPARHGAILLPWRAAREALCKAGTHS